MSNLDETKLKELTLILSSFFADNLPNCEGLGKSILTCNSQKEIVSNLRCYRDEIFEALGGESIYYLEEQIEDLESEVKFLEGKIEETEDKFNEVRLNLGDTINDERKRETALTYIKDFYPWELELLLKNGRQLLDIFK